MNRTLKRPMFRIGGSAGTGITSGLDQPRKQYKEGTPNPYNMGAFSPGSLPGFLTSFGLDLLSRPPQGNIFQTAAAAARGPFDRFQAGQAAAMKTASDRAFARELSQEEREFEAGQLEKKLAAQERIAAMDTGNLDKRLEAARKDFGDDIKAARAVDFADNKFKELEDRFGEGQVATTVIDSDNYQRKGSLEKFVKQNPRIAGLKIYDVATNKPVIIVTDTETGKLKLVPADSADIDTTGEGMPAPESQTPRSFDYLSPGQKKVIEDIRAGSDKEFGIGFYD